MSELRYSTNQNMVVAFSIAVTFIFLGLLFSSFIGIDLIGLFNDTLKSFFHIIRTKEIAQDIFLQISNISLKIANPVGIIPAPGPVIVISPRYFVVNVIELVTPKRLQVDYSEESSGV